MVRGKHCEYKAMLKKTDIEPMVIEAIREIVRNEEYAQAIKKRIGVQIDTKAVDKELEGYQAKLKEVDLNKTRLEREIDSLPADAKYRERKLHDMTLRLDSLYDVIVPFPVSWTVKMKKKQKETQDILSYHTQAAGCSDKARAKASGGRQPIEECGRTGL